MTEVRSAVRSVQTADGRTIETAIPVVRLNEGIKARLERIGRIWVRGTVVNWSRSAAGHRYFTLADEHADATVKCAFFRGDAWRFPDDPEPGMNIFAEVLPTVYTKSGKFQLTVKRVQIAGEEGLWKVKLEKLRKRLAAEGLFDPGRRRPLPRFPNRVGVATSRHGAALQDILKVLRRRAPWVDVVIADCRVQGEGAPASVRRAIQRLVAWGTNGPEQRLDVILVARGGGSAEELWCFNDEITVRAVADCPVPVICGIGHETDVTLSELAADKRASTPSTAAALAVPDREQASDQLDRMATALAHGLSRTNQGAQQRLVQMEERIPRAMERLLAAAASSAAHRGNALERALRRRLDGARGQLAKVASTLDALSPLATIARGYAVATDPQGSTLTSIGDFLPESRFRLALKDGCVTAVTESIHGDAYDLAEVLE